MLLDWFIFLLVFYIVIDFFCVNTVIDDEEENGNVRNLTSVVVIPNEQENAENDELPPYTPPTPKTKAAFADLPPSYDETWDITETNINTISEDNSNSTIVNTTTNSNNNLPSSFNANTNPVPQIVISPVNQPVNTQVQPVA